MKYQPVSDMFNKIGEINHTGKQENGN